MGAMGRYLMALSPVARDRVVMGQRWVSHRMVDGEGGGCLRGHAEGLAATMLTMQDLGELLATDLPRLCGMVDVEANRVFFGFVRLESSWRDNPAGAFNLACERFGLPRVVRAIKLRAARLNGSDASTIAAILEQPSEARV